MLTRKEKIELVLIVLKGIIVMGAIVTCILMMVKGLTAEAKSPYKLDNMYAKTAMVYELDRTCDIVYVVDSNGEAWTFEGCEDYELGDYVSMIMYDNGTQSIYDDIILKVQYSGYSAEGWAINLLFLFRSLYSNI